MKGKTCQIKVFSAPFRRNQTGITVFYLCYHHSQLKSDSRKRKGKINKFEGSIRSSYSI
ncbi:hypothetical protein GQ55_4G041400 [Panicum hallii var. hallii]|uniref:Uncharacterized protein n=1 Tax=Panicum hallii var. hallii TaxID=1504633 RepID=A0A2T7DV53_9POAL|nr:hypothetical protein GQ55_4G041400 [Panicum hallii var. hallii]